MEQTAKRYMPFISIIIPVYNVQSLIAHTAISTLLHRFTQILESLLNLYSHICVYPNLWAHKALRQAPSTKSTHYRFVEVA